MRNAGSSRLWKIAVWLQYSRVVEHNSKQKTKRHYQRTELPLENANGLSPASSHMSICFFNLPMGYKLYRCFRWIILLNTRDMTESWAVAFRRLCLGYIYIEKWFKRNRSNEEKKKHNWKETKTETKNGQDWRDLHLWDGEEPTANIPCFVSLADSCHVKISRYWHWHYPKIQKQKQNRRSLVPSSERYSVHIHRLSCQWPIDSVGYVIRLISRSSEFSVIQVIFML